MSSSLAMGCNPTVNFGCRSVKAGWREEKLSRIEHDLIKKVHPQVNEIKEGMEEMIAVVKENVENNPPPTAKKKGH